MARRVSELTRVERRRAVLLTCLRVAAAWVVLFAAYYLSPVDELKGDHVTLLLLGTTLVYGAVVALQARGVGRAAVPQLRAIQAVGISIPFFIVLFACIYLALEHNSPANFSAPLNHTAALYFTVTLLATVGFGDIAPVSNVARIVVSVQMMLDLVVLGVVVRVMFSAVKRNIGEPAEPPGIIGRPLPPPELRPPADEPGDGA